MADIFSKEARSGTIRKVKSAGNKSTEIKKKNTETLNEKLQVLLSPGVQE